ncbi:LLM class flavin-dependent oxidoreductase [Kineosporia babensis]|uniref:LLM class flavin-dependent oxidoreductase n=1 Tax=Kineosporia babensis TaxID=499548 RepID=A0A9X1SUY7_9ACTN|nr:LLM class flavin-dependent oxidoreductase [Kineosporia babensis]MCD5312235.1 LLM class flavin-dependent oxidoreductase [Kineosporia babensis]
MTDYGHELLFGSFLTPSAQDAEQVVALAQFAEGEGLDLVTFQDHPYQPAFLDTLTLMSYVAAATSRIRIAGNVLNLPLRQPVVLARSAASLDLLSGGRYELGLGAGAFWDAIEAAGGRRLSPKQAVEALDEAIQVIRGVWSSERGGVRVPGEYYQVNGAKRGPAAAHPIGIWLGAYKPRMLALTGRTADGWLPSLSYLPGGPGDLVEMNQRIDDAAQEAGREPAAVRRLLNIGGQFSAASGGLLQGPPKQWVEELTDLALTHGISGFVLAGDDPQAMRLFAAEVAPAVRENVETERRNPASTDQGRAGSPSAPTSPDTPNDGRPSAPGAQASVAGKAGNATKLRAQPTRDDGVRLSSRTMWDETTRPQAPSAPAGHDYSEMAQSAGQHLIDVHDHLRSELDELRGLIEQVKEGRISAGQARSEINQMTMRQNDWTLGAYCARYCRTLTTHHTLEDAQIFPHLRAADTGLAPVIDRLESEHRAIHDILTEVDSALVGYVRNPDDFTGLDGAVDLLTDMLRSHLAYEEQQIVEPLARFGFFPGQL